jgi:hypothetical protein
MAHVGKGDVKTLISRYSATTTVRVSHNEPYLEIVTKIESLQCLEI